MIKEYATYNKKETNMLMCVVNSTDEQEKMLDFLSDKGYEIPQGIYHGIYIIFVRLEEKRISYSSDYEFNINNYDTEEHLNNYIENKLYHLRDYNIYLIEDFEKLKEYFEPLSINTYFKNIKSYDSFVNERVYSEMNSNINGFILYTDDLSEDEIKKVYKILFDRGYKLGGRNKVEDIHTNELNCNLIIIYKEGMYLLYNGKDDSEVSNDIDSINNLFISYRDYKDYYLFKDMVDFNKYFNVLNINNYFDKRNVYESLLDKMEGPSEEEYIKNIIKKRPLKTFGLFKNKKNINDLLISSCEDGSLKGVKLALENGAEPSYSNNAVITITASRGYLDILMYLDTHYNLINNDNLYGALTSSIYSSDEKILTYLMINYGYKLKLSNTQKLNLLLKCVERDNINALKYLIKNGYDHHLNYDMVINTATQNHRYEILDYLLSLGELNMDLDYLLNRIAVSNKDEKILDILKK